MIKGMWIILLVKRCMNELTKWKSSEQYSELLSDFQNIIKYEVSESMRRYFFFSFDKYMKWFEQNGHYIGYLMKI